MKYYSGEELWNKMREVRGDVFVYEWRHILPIGKREINAIAEFAKIPKPAPPSRMEVYEKWQADFDGVVNDGALASLLLRLMENSAAHKEYNRE